MKTRFDPRHQRRVDIFRELFSYSFVTKDPREWSETIKPIIEKQPEIDALISEKAPDWPVERLNKVDLAILRLAIFELIFEKKNPPKVVVDEAIELGKEYGSESTAKFVNGVLGGILSKFQLNLKLDATETTSA